MRIYLKLNTTHLDIIFSMILCQSFCAAAIDVFVSPFVFQLMGSFVLAVGLWLRFDPETVSLLSGSRAPDTFFLGEYQTKP